MLNEDFDDALTMALDAHRQQIRKDDRTPYMAHLMTVCALVMEMGGSQHAIIAALLHDTIEDAGGDIMRQAIAQRFSSTVARIVEEVTETDANPKPPWKERKLAYIAHLETATHEALLVALADKIHNARDTWRAKVAGIDVWARFNAPKSEQKWWYEELEAAFYKRLGRNELVRPYLHEFTQILDELFIRADEGEH